MSESSSEKTEQPTPKRLRDAREKGDIPKSNEVVSISVVLGAAMYFLVQGPEIFVNLKGVVSEVIDLSFTRPFNEALELISEKLINSMVSILAPLLMVVIIAAILSQIMQNGVVVAPEAARPKLSNLNPKNWFKKVFSKKNLFELFLNLFKVMVLTLSVYLAMRSSFQDVMRVHMSTIWGLLIVLGELVKTLFIYTLSSFLIIAVADWIFTKTHYTKEHMMTMEEVKREFKEMEGDPIIKSRRRQLMREMAEVNTLDSVRKAKVLIVNPTHYAVAIDYDKEVSPLPYTLAKGEGDLARRMIEVAKEEKIPIMRNAPLARQLYAEANEREHIPSSLLLQVAEVLKVVLELDKKPQ